MFNFKVNEIQSIWKSYVKDESKMIIVYPSKRKNQWAILYIISKDFNFDQAYTEKEINAILKNYHVDYVRIRRDLIDNQFLSRTKDGSIYTKLEIGL